MSNIFKKIGNFCSKIKKNREKKIPPKYFVTMKKYFSSRCFFTIWIMPIESQKIIWSTREHSQNPSEPVKKQIFMKKSPKTWILEILETQVRSLGRQLRPHLKFGQASVALRNECDVLLVARGGLPAVAETSDRLRIFRTLQAQSRL